MLSWAWCKARGSDAWPGGASGGSPCSVERCAAHAVAHGAPRALDRAGAVRVVEGLHVPWALQ